MGKYQIIAYCDNRMLPNVQEKDIKKLTIVNIAFAHVIDNAVVGDHLTNLGCIANLRKMNPALKVLVSVGGWGAGGFSDAAFTVEGRKLFARTAVELIRQWDMDGVDIDWEYPCHYQANIDARPEDKYTFTLMMKELREELDRYEKVDNRKYMLTMAAGADRYFCHDTEMDKVQEYCDYVQLMTYDMRNGFTTLSGHHTGLYNTPGDLFLICADECVKDFIAHGVPKEKLVLGAAFYGRQWAGVENKHNGLLMHAKAPGTSMGNYAKLYEEYINKNGYVRYWDDDAKAPYLFNGETFISYDDPESLKYKCEYVKEQGLLGLMYWVYIIDPTDEMLPAIYNTLNA